MFKANKFLHLLPISFIIISLIGLSVFFRVYLSESSSQVAEDFIAQNRKEIATYNTPFLITKLNNLTSTTNWVCIEARFRAQTFYSQKKGNCSNSFFVQKILQHHIENGPYDIEFSLRLPGMIEKLFASFFAFQLFVLTSYLALNFQIIKLKTQNAIRLKQLADQVAHDLRSPLAVLESNSKTNTPLQNEAIKRIKEIAEDLLVKHRQNCLNNFSNAKNILSLLIEEKKITYLSKSPIIEGELTLPSDLISKTNELTRLLSNLLNNAIEASDHPEIEIKTQKTESHFQIYIKDNGCGIPQDLLEKLGKESFTTKTEGNGIGLLSAFQKMKEWGGELKIKSTPNVGTTIILNFPFDNAEPALIVLVDDDALVRLNWEARAKKSQVHFRVFSTAQELIETLETLPKDTRFYLDLEIKNSSHSGLELAKILKSKGFYDLHLASGHEQIESDLFLTQRNKSCPF